MNTDKQGLVWFGPGTEDCPGSLIHIYLCSSVAKMFYLFQH